MSITADQVDAYFARIGWTGPVAADRATLAAIALHHPAEIAFENLDPLLGRRVRLDVPSLVEKLVYNGRGGYCFEHNGLLQAVLEHIGFAVTPLIARVVWMQSDDIDAAPTHMLLRVDLDDGPVLIDVGFGGAVMTGILDLVPDAVQDTPLEPYRLLESDGVWRSQIRFGADAWHTMYRFTLAAASPADYEMGNWFTATHPDSPFTAGLMCARTPPGRRLTMRDGAFGDRVLGAEPQRHILQTPEETCDLLEDAFRIAIPDRDALLERLRDLAR